MSALCVRLGSAPLRYGHVLLAAVDPPTEPSYRAFDKDYYYLGIEHLGVLGIHQAGSSLLLRPGIGGLYYANEPYELRCDTSSRQFWVEIPREAFDRRFESRRPPLLTQ